ncbi:DWARF open reading frame isoform X1 [Athene cunicularia]|uniref:DWARF open reading frame isoform X1 n=1 Tax=Athene cunicularia TaxID=194338 RepID=UPI000EF645A0|nr:DWARF open reading frame isoform X1 [Athene cunicularia]
MQPMKLLYQRELEMMPQSTCFEVPRRTNRNRTEATEHKLMEEQVVWYNIPKEDVISTAVVREEAALKKAQVPLSRLVVPILLAVGWIVGCALMVYIVFS